ncbi:hypothetical protein ABZP36_026052 [Zizania latifolia]
MGSTDRKVGGIGVAADEAGRRGCVECRATTTPMWRSGPTGPRCIGNKSCKTESKWLPCAIRFDHNRQLEN